MRKSIALAVVFLAFALPVFADAALTTNLVSYWKLDESSGNASDSAGSNTLTNVSIATFGVGKINNAVYLASASTQYLENTTPTGLRVSTDFTVNNWVYFTTTPASGVEMTIASVWNGSRPDRAWLEGLFNISGTLDLDFVTDNGAASGQYDTAWTPTTATWYMVTAVYTISTNKVQFYVNGATPRALSPALTGISVTGSSAAYRIGNQGNGGAPINSPPDSVAVL